MKKIHRYLFIGFTLSQSMINVSHADMFFCWCTANDSSTGEVQSWQLPTEEGGDCSQAKASASSDCNSEASEKGLINAYINGCSGAASNSC